MDRVFTASFVGTLTSQPYFATQPYPRHPWLDLPHETFLYLLNSRETPTDFYNRSIQWDSKSGPRSVRTLPWARDIHMMWSYFYVVLTDPGGIPPNWRPEIDEEGGQGAPLVESEYSGAGLVSNQSVMAFDPANQKVRFCRKCNHYKPPRCHHCSVCGRCILKMDHHCVWVVNCIGALNYKYFLLFLFYTFLETTLVALSLLRYFMAFFTDEEISGTLGTVAASFITFVLNLAFALSVLGFMLMHLSLVASNTTTIEAYEKKSTPKWHYDLGRKKNFEQVFGTDKWYWFIPAYSEEDLRRIPALQGIDYPTRPELHALQQL